MKNNKEVKTRFEMGWNMTVGETAQMFTAHEKRLQRGRKVNDPLRRKQDRVICHGFLYLNQLKEKRIN